MEKWHATLTTIFPPNFSLCGATTRDDVDVYCTRTKKTIVHNLRMIIPGVEKMEHSKNGRTLPSMTDTGDTQFQSLEPPQHQPPLPPPPPPMQSALTNPPSPPPLPHPTPPPAPVNPHHRHQPHRKGQGRHHQQPHQQGQNQYTQVENSMFMEWGKRGRTLWESSISLGTRPKDK